jgi:hypothetical protein
MTRPDDVEWRCREELRLLLTALRSRWTGNSGKRLREDDAPILSGLSTRRYAALERGTVENPSLDLIENVASGRAELTICARIHNLILSGSTQTYSAICANTQWRMFTRRDCHFPNLRLSLVARSRRSRP